MKSKAAVKMSLAEMPVELEQPFDLFLEYWAPGVAPSKTLVKLFAEHPLGVAQLELDVESLQSLLEDVRAEGESGEFEERNLAAAKVLQAAVLAAKEA